MLSSSANASAPSSLPRFDLDLPIFAHFETGSLATGRSYLRDVSKAHSFLEGLLADGLKIDVLVSFYSLQFLLYLFSSSYVCNLSVLNRFSCVLGVSSWFESVPVDLTLSPFPCSFGSHRRLCSFFVLFFLLHV